MPDDTINYQNMLDEAISDRLPDYMQKALGRIHGNDTKEYLALEPPPKTSKIRDRKVAVNPHTAKEFLESLFQFGFDDARVHIETFQNEVKSHPILHALLTQCLNPAYSNLNLVQPWITDIYTLIKKPVLYLPEGKKTKEQIATGNPRPAVLSKNLVNINTWLSRVDAILGIKITNPFLFPAVNNLCSFISDDGNKLDIGIFAESKLYFIISGEAEDILRMSISNFYDSCQNLYDGDLNDKLLANVFDRHMKVGYIILDMPYKDRKGNLHPYMALSRAIIRDVGKGLFIDKVYPERTKDEFCKIAKQSGIKNVVKKNPLLYYIKSSDLPNGMCSPYMDSLDARLTIFEPNVSLKTVEKYVADLLKKIGGDDCDIYVLEENLEKIPLVKESIKKFCLDTLWNRVKKQKQIIYNGYLIDMLFRFTVYDEKMENYLLTLFRNYRLASQMNKNVKSVIDPTIISPANRSKLLKYFGIRYNKYDYDVYE